MDRETIIEDLETIKQHFLTETGGAFPEALEEAIKVCKASAWIPVTSRKMTDEEVEEYAPFMDISPEEMDEDDRKIFECQMPEDGQEILITIGSGAFARVETDICEKDGFCIGLESNGDWAEITAWMPMPEPYKKEGDQ